MDNLESLSQIWNLIVESNTFNFLIVLTILIFCIVKFDLKSVLISMQNKIIQTIEDAKQNKLNSEEVLGKAQDSVKNIQSDIDKINDDAKQSAEVISKKIIDDANRQAESININADKVISAEEKRIVDTLIKDISKASLEKSEQNIRKMLENDLSLHEKYINESINELDGLKI